MAEKFCFYDSEKFIEEVIPVLISGKKTLKAVFSTYNDVHSYDTGFVETDNEGLEIFVINGCRESDFNTFFLKLAAFTSKKTDLASKIIVNTIKHDQKDAENSLNCVKDIALNAFDPEDEFLYFTYVGLHAMKQSLNFAKDIKYQYPKATVIIVACDCGKSEKSRILFEANRAGKIDYAILCQNCGGQTDMEMLVRGLIKKWGSS
jgi:hypothetical protein